MMMSQDFLTPKSTVADVLDRFPQAIPVFISHHMSCVGCSMSMFETLEDAARIYRVPLDTFLEALRASIEGESEKNESV